MALDFFKFAEYFPPIDTNEGREIINVARSSENTLDIFLLASSTVSDLANLIMARPDPLVDAFQRSLTQRASEVVSNITPADPNNPTPQEEVAILAGLRMLYSAWPDAKQGALTWIVQLIADPNKPDTYTTLIKVSKLSTGDIMSMARPEFFEALARYYLVMASRYVSTAFNRYTLTGRVLDGGTRQSKSGVQVNVTDKSFAKPRAYGSAFTNEQGYFRVNLPLFKESLYYLDLEFTHPQISGISSKTIEFDPNKSGGIFDFEFKFIPLASKSKTIASTGVTIPADVRAYLAAEGITLTRLEDIRRLGGLINIPDPGINKQNMKLLKLDAFANLELVNVDIAQNNTLLARGYTSIARIATTPRKDFVARNNNILGVHGAAQVHYQASATHLFTLNSLAGRLTSTPSATSNPAPIGPATGCGCSDCASAVGPLAYLADLLCFSLDNINTSTGTSLTLPYLKANFFQDLGALPASCISLNTTMCQNRIAAEVLRQYYATAAIANTRTEVQQDAFDTAERSYLANTYELLLNKLGTGYLEIRKMRGVQDDEERKKVSDRLGIILDDDGDFDTPDTIAQLFIDQSTGANPTEAELEALFGYRRTTPFTLAPIPESKVSKWKKARLRETWSEQDRPSNAYWKTDDRKVIIDPDLVTVDDLRFPETGDSVYDIWKARRKFLDDVLQGMATLPLNAIRVFRTDAFADKQLIVAYGANFYVPPSDSIIHYNGNSIDQDFTVLKQYGIDGNTYFKVKEILPGNDVGGTISSDSNPSFVNGDVGVLQADPLITLMLTDAQFSYNGTILPAIWETDIVGDSLDGLRAAHAGAVSGNAGAQATIISLGLTVASAGRLLELYDKHKLNPLNPDATGNLAPEEWREFQDILISALKYFLSETYPTAEAPLWKTEEAAINLGPQHFWAAINGPRPGSWPILAGDDALLDPVLTPVSAITEITARSIANNQFDMGGVSNTTGAAVLEARGQALDTAEADMMGQFGVEPFEGVLNTAFNEVDPNDWTLDKYNEVLTELGDPVLSDCATQIITERFLIAVEDFKFVMDVVARNAGGTTVPDGDLSRFWSILAEALRKNKFTPDWKGEEAVVEQWKFRKAQLPTWRASAADRQAWLAALAENSEAPIIDADLIGPGDLRDPVDSDPVFTLWKQRWVEIHGPYAGYPDDGASGFLWDVDVSGLDSTAEFDALTNTHLGHVESGLGVIREQMEAGTDVVPRLAQLQLSSTEFLQLLSLRDILPETAPGNQLTSEEKKTVQRILAQVQKRRKAFDYRLEEALPANAITLSQDFFRMPETPELQFPPAPEYPLTPWLAAESDLIAWRRTLSGRIGQEDSVVKALEAMLFEVDEAMMVHLRDALTLLCGDPALDLLRNARAIGNKLLIDLENNCCYKTNRVAAAIELLQQLLWKTRTGDILADYPAIEYRGEDFDEAWTWMGSYGNWRAAMFVFLYPENVLLPSLRKEQSPAFKAVLEATQNNRRFGPEDACQVARDYRDYLVDVADLELKCSAEAEVFMRTTGCGTQTTDKPRYLFVFAQGRVSHNPYYSTVDARNKVDIMQNGYWQAIPGLDDTTRIVGCHVYHIYDTGEEYIYLFFTRTGSDNKEKFFALRFNLLNGLWEEEPLEFKVEIDDLTFALNYPGTEYAGFKKEDFSPEIQAIAVRHCNDVGAPPMIAVSLNKVAGVSQDVYTFYWGMGEAGKEFKSRWNGDGWRLYIEGSKVLKGKVRFFVGIWVDENYKQNDHSLLVLSTKTTNGISSTWTWWNAQLQILNDFLDGHYSFFESLHFNGQDYWWPDVYQLRKDWINQEPEQLFQTEHSPTDYLAYIQIFGGTNYADTLYLPTQYNTDVAKEIRFLLPFHDRNTIHLEFTQNGDRRQDVVAYSPADPNVPLIFKTGSLPASAFPEGMNFVAPVRDARFFDPTNGAFEATGGLLLHQALGSGSLIGVSWEGKAYDAGAPVNSTMQVTASATNLTPSLPSVPIIQDNFTVAELDMRRTASQFDLEQNTDPNFRLAEYVHEAYYFVPLQIALQLCANGFYQDALDWLRTIYDISRPLDERKIWYGLVQEEQGVVNTARAADWYSDPLNPHAIAGMRPFTYTRYTILAIAQCILAYADGQFTSDNSESVPRARELYEDADELLNLLVTSDPCPYDAALQTFASTAVLGAWQSSFDRAFEEMEPLSMQPGFNTLVTGISAVLGGSTSLDAQLSSVNSLISTAQGQVEVRTFDDVLDDGRTLVDNYAAAALAGEAADTTATNLSATTGRTFNRVVATVTGLPEADLGTADLPWLMDDQAPLAVSRANEVDRVNMGRTGLLVDRYNELPASGLQINSPFPNIGFSGLPFTFCVVPNPIVKALLMTAEVQLWKIHNCMNIAGLVRELDPFAAPTDSSTGIPVIGMGGTLTIPSDRQLPPSAYRYRVLVDRAKQLTAMAQQVESAFLATLEKADAERYSQLRAEQDIQTSMAGVKLQDLKVKEANDGVKLAELQRDRAQLQVNGLQGMIDAGLLGSEQLMVMNYTALGTLQALAAWANATAQNLQGAVQAASAGGGVSVGMSIAAAFAANAVFSTQNLVAAAIDVSIVGLNTANSIASIYASFERRKQDWEYQKTLANQDVKIGEQGIALANDRVQITGQEREIALLQSDHAKATLDFLKNKFTSAELYEWMSGVLGDIYAYLLQEATAMAALAQRQLSFERQVDLPPFIRTDYWIVDANSMGGVSLTGEGAVDRRGITGSSRLLMDLTRLDQYAFSTNSPKLQMSKTISLNEIAPEELMGLRDNGSMAFYTTKAMFDSDYPGHYLRLIKKVSVTVIALNPPIKGIRATLSNGGTSTVVTGGAIFQTRTITRYPEEIALSGGVNDHGVFQMQAEGEFLNPFEGHGVETQWNFRMEKAANPFNFDSIADVLITIEYEALSSFTYRQSVIAQLNNEPRSANLALSFKNNLPDQWFDLKNPDQVALPFAVTFNVADQDLAPDVLSPRTIENVSVYFLMKDGESFMGQVTLGFGDLPGLTATPNDNIISTRTNAQGFVSLQGMQGPEGAWSFALEDSATTRSFMAQDKIEDILLVITYGGEHTDYSA